MSREPDESGAQKSSLSFGFAKGKPSKTLKKSAICDVEDAKEKTEFLSDFDGKVKKDTSINHETLVIPMQNTNDWKRKLKLPTDLEKDDDEDDDKPAPAKKARNVQHIPEGDSADSQAARELLADARARTEGWEDRDKEVSVTISMNEDKSDRLKLDPDDEVKEATLEDYDSVPIEAFGKGCLRGMGWKDGQGIGKKHKRVKPIEVNVRPKGLGLGADRSQSEQNGKAGDKGGKNETEAVSAELKRGVCCVITAGKHSDKYAKVEGVDEDNARVVLKLAVGGESVNLTQNAVRTVSSKEYDKNKLYLNKGKADRYKDEQAGYEGSKEKKHHKKSRDRSRSPQSDSHDRHKRSRDKHSHKGSTQYSDDENSTDRNGKYDKKPKKVHHKRSPSPLAKEDIWWQPKLRVRVIDEDYCAGRYFKEKVVIEDVISQDCCVCRTSSGKLLEDVTQRQLETVIPRAEGSYVMVVRGQYKGQAGQMLSRDRHRATADVQLLSLRERVLQLGFDTICEYVGDVTEEEDY